jgi:hypothetical protein
VPETSQLLSNIFSVLLVLLPGAIWCAWWLFCVNWPKLWSALARGAWTGVVLFILVCGSVWARLDPRDLAWPGYYISALPWHIGAAALLACLAFLCGWLQGVLGWTAPEFPVHPVAAEHGHGHANGHGHH